MAMVVMFSTMSFSINKHYCMEHLVDVSIILPAQDCGMDMNTPETQEGMQLTAVPCCADEHIAIEGQDEVKPAAEWSPEKIQVFTSAFLISYNLLLPAETTQTPVFTTYRPPLITENLPVIYETYLI